MKLEPALSAFAIQALCLAVATAAASCGGRTPGFPALADASGDDQTYGDDGATGSSSGVFSSSGFSTSSSGFSSSGFGSSSGFSSSGFSSTSSSGFSSSTSSSGFSSSSGSVGFPSPFFALTPGVGDGASCPPTCDRGSVCIDDTVQKVCAKRCTDGSACPASAPCCTLLSDGSGACIGVGSTGNWPGQQCRCVSSLFCPGPQVCTPALDNAGNPTGPNVCR
jgi:hypothetical protein